MFNLEEIAIASPQFCCLHPLGLRLVISDRELRLPVAQTQDIRGTFKNVGKWEVHGCSTKSPETQAPSRFLCCHSQGFVIHIGCLSSCHHVHIPASRMEEGTMKGAVLLCISISQEYTLHSCLNPTDRNVPT